MIAIFGFGGYTWPRDRVEGCRFCLLSTGGRIPFYEHKAPIAFTESGSTDSTIGCTSGFFWQPPLRLNWQPYIHAAVLTMLTAGAAWHVRPSHAPAC